MGLRLVNVDYPSSNRPITVILSVLVTLTCLQVAVDFQFYRFESSTPNSFSSAVSWVSQIWAFLGASYLSLHRSTQTVGILILTRRILLLLTLYLLAVTLVNGGQILTYIPTIFLCWAISRHEITHDYFLRIIVISCTLVLGLSLLTLVLDPNSAVMSVNADRFTPFSGQVAGVTPHPNTLGLFAGFGLGTALLTDFNSRQFRFFLGLISIILIVGSGSRLAYWLGALAILLFFLRAGRFSISKSLYRYVVFSFSFLAIFWVIVGVEPLLRVLNGRDKIWEEYIRFWQQQPVFGGGFEAGRSIIMNATNTVTLANGGQSHNEFIGDLVRGGVIGLGLVLLGGLLVFRKLRDQGLFEHAEVTFVCAALLSVAFVEQLLVFTLGSRTIFTILLFMLSVVSAKYLGAAHSGTTPRNSLQRLPKMVVQ